MQKTTNPGTRKALFTLKTSNAVYILLSIGAFYLNGLNVWLSIGAGIATVVVSVIIAQLIYNTKICEQQQHYTAFYSLIITWVLVALVFKFSLPWYFSGIAMYIIGEAVALMIFAILKGRVKAVTTVAPSLFKKELTDHSKEFKTNMGQTWRDFKDDVK